MEQRRRITVRLLQQRHQPLRGDHVGPDRQHRVRNRRKPTHRDYQSGHDKNGLGAQQSGVATSPIRHCQPRPLGQQRHKNDRRGHNSDLTQARRNQADPSSIPIARRPEDRRRIQEATVRRAGSHVDLSRCNGGESEYRPMYLGHSGQARLKLPWGLCATHLPAVNVNRLPRRLGNSRTHDQPHQHRANHSCLAMATIIFHERSTFWVILTSSYHSLNNDPPL